MVASPELQLTDWRREVNELYAGIRREPDPREGHELWRSTRDRLFRAHPQTPLLADDPIHRTGIPYWPYDPALRFELALQPADHDEHFDIPTTTDGTIRIGRVGRVELPEPLGFGLDVWWLRQYGGGLFIPLRDGTAGTSTYGGGRYLLDTAKGADLGGDETMIVIDLNFAYHPSCRYNPRWVCPLAPEGNTTPISVEAGERL